MPGKRCFTDVNVWAIGIPVLVFIVLHWMASEWCDWLLVQRDDLIQSLMRVRSTPFGWLLSELPSTEDPHDWMCCIPLLGMLRVGVHRHFLVDELQEMIKRERESVMRRGGWVFLGSTLGFVSFCSVSLYRWLRGSRKATGQTSSSRLGKHTDQRKPVRFSISSSSTSSSSSSYGVTPVSPVPDAVATASSVPEAVASASPVPEAVTSGSSEPVLKELDPSKPDPSFLHPALASVLRGWMELEELGRERTSTTSAHSKHSRSQVRVLPSSFPSMVSAAVPIVDNSKSVSTIVIELTYHFWLALIALEKWDPHALQDMERMSVEDICSKMCSVLDDSLEKVTYEDLIIILGATIMVVCQHNLLHTCCEEEVCLRCFKNQLLEHFESCGLLYSSTSSEDSSEDDSSLSSISAVC